MFDNMNELKRENMKWRIHTSAVRRVAQNDTAALHVYIETSLQGRHLALEHILDLQAA
jgi:hypothetical protein